MSTLIHSGQQSPRGGNVPNNTTWLTKTEAAQYLNVHPETVYRLWLKHEIKRSGALKNARYSQDSLDRYIRQHKPWYTPKLSA